jgi:phosphoserine phosphatase
MHAFVSLQAAIRNQIERAGGSPFAVLDFDNTCIVNDIAEATLAYICRHELLKRADLLTPEARQCDAAYHRDVFRRYYELLRRGDLEAASFLCARVLAGFTSDEAEDLVTATIDAEGSLLGAGELYGITIARGIAVRPALRMLIDFLAASDVDVWIVSASPEIAVRAAMKRLGLCGNLIALRNGMCDSVISTELAAPYSVGAGKVDCIRTFIDAGNRPVLGVGDSAHDVPMIEYANLHAIVDCGNGLRHQARQRGWFILQ